ncbi:MAG TPA: hypothetical protein VIF81_06755 [Pyrinomonadaceae bacterium]
MRKSTTKYLMLVAAVVVAIVATGLVVSAQNSNSSTTMAPSNSNTAKPRRPRHRRPRPKASPEAAADTGAMATETPAPAPRRTGRCDPTQQEQTDLSGTYTGKAKHGDEPAMDATLTITGNNFTMSMGSDTHSGRIVAVTTCGYTAVTVMPEGAPHAHSLRAKKVGDSLTLMSVPGEPEKMMFTTGGGMRRPRKHRMHKPAATPSTTPPQQ